MVRSDIHIATIIKDNSGDFLTTVAHLWRCFSIYHQTLAAVGVVLVLFGELKDVGNTILVSIGAVVKGRGSVVVMM